MEENALAQVEYEAIKMRALVALASIFIVSEENEHCGGALSLRRNSSTLPRHATRHSQDESFVNGL